MMKEVEKMMKGSVHEDYLFIVYDGLVLMTSKETIERMRAIHMIKYTFVNKQWIAQAANSRIRSNF